MPLEPASGEGRDIPIPQSLGKYVPIARLGSGGMAEVFLAVARGPVRFNKLAVVKRLRNSDEAVQVEMFLDEARLAARLNHTNIVHTYEVGEAQGKYFIAMEYLEGQSLHTLVARLKVRANGLSDPLAAYVAAQALKGLHFAHQLNDFDGSPLGVVHRDVSPHNLYLTYDGEVKVLDFGVAKTKMNSGHTEIGMVKGKIRYMAPEQLGDGNVDQRADVFALGVVLWELLARRPLFQGDAPSVMARVVGEDAAPVRKHRPAVSPELEAITVKALKRNPDERYASADDMRAALETFLRGKDEAFDRELSALMNETFAKTRDEVRGRIKSFLEVVPSEESGENIMVEGAGFGRTSDLPTLPKGTDSVGPQSTPTRSTSPTAPTAPQRSPRWSWLLLAVGFSVSGVIALGRLGRRIQEGPSAETASTSAATPPSAKDPAGSQTGSEVVTFPSSGARLASASASAPGPTPSEASIAASTGAPPSTSASKSAPAPSPAAAGAKSPTAPVDHRPLGAPSVPPATGPAAPASARPRLNIRVLDDSDSP